MDRRAFIATLLGALAAPELRAQQPRAPVQLGFLRIVAPPRVYIDALEQGLRDRGYIPGRDVVIQYRFSDDRESQLDELAKELVNGKVAIILVAGNQAIRAARKATQTIPIVMVTTADPIAAGLIDSLAHPNGNITGVTRYTRHLSGKRLELLKELIPQIRRVGVLGTAGSDSTRDTGIKYYEAASKSLNLESFPFEIRGQKPDLENAFRDATQAKVNAIVISSGAVTISYRKAIAALAISNRIPSICERDDYVESGCLISYSADEAESYRRAAVYVDKILKGAKPADLPVEQPTKFELVINLKTAKQIGVTIPPNVLTRADRVIK